MFAKDRMPCIHCPGLRMIEPEIVESKWCITEITFDKGCFNLLLIVVKRVLYKSFSLHLYHIELNTMQAAGSFGFEQASQDISQRAELAIHQQPKDGVGVLYFV